MTYATANGTATSPGNYFATTGTVSWASGDSSAKTISVPVVAGSFTSGSKNFTVTLNSITGGVMVSGTSATVNIEAPAAMDSLFTPDSINGTVDALLVQPDGKILIGGWFNAIYTAGGTYARNGFARLNSDGTTDTAFGNGSGANIRPVTAMALQPDGKILIGGAFTSIHGTTRNHVARLNTDGSLDTSFDPGTGPDNEVHSIAVQPDGKILIGGNFANVSGTSRIAIARLTSAGALDTGFSGPPFQGFPADVLSIALQPDNKPVIAGGFYSTPSPWKSGVARLNTDGSRDTTFDPGYGAHISGNNGFLQTVQKVAVQRDGKIVVGGYFTGFNNVTHTRIARLSGSGTLDSTFNPSIDPSVPANTSPYPNVHALLIQPDGKIFIGGEFAQVSGSALNRFARLNSDGTLDTSFIVGNGAENLVYDSALQTDGTLLLCGFGTVEDVANRTVARIFSGLPGLPGTIQFSSPSYTGAEGNTVTITATRAGGSYGAVSVNYATIPGTATTTDYTATAGTLSWADGDAANKTFTVALTYDGIAESDETFSLNLGIPIGGTALGTQGCVNVPITTAYNLWKTSRFTAGELLDPTISGDSADPDHDGIPNALEYALGLDPKIVNTNKLPTGSIQNISGSKYLSLTFRRVPAAIDLTYTPQLSGNLTSWGTGAVQVGSAVSNGDGSETVTYRDTVLVSGTTRRFMRLQVTRTP